MEGVIPGLVLMSEVTGTPALFARSRDPANVAQFFKNSFIQPACQLVTMSFCTEGSTTLNSKYSDNPFLVLKGYNS